MLPTPLGHGPSLGPGFVPADYGGATIKRGTTPGDAPALGRFDAPLCAARGGAPFSVAPAEPLTHTQYPYVTGNSVLAVKYRDGVMMACDMLGSYGSTKRYKSVERMTAVGERTLVGASGEVSDFTYIKNLLDELTTNDFCFDDGTELQPKEVLCYMQRVMYNRRNKFDPLWNSLVIAGVDEKGEALLGLVGMIGQNYTDSHVATGFGAHLARPIFRERHTDDMSYDEAKALLCDGLKVCYYRDKNSINKFQLATVTKEGVSISDPFALQTEWSYQLFHHPSEKIRGTW